jgi:CO/xanthine dehydrogenase FAD-binding subunit
MKPVDFGYVRPSTIAGAVTALAGAQGEAKVIAGGQSLGPLLNMRLVRPALLVDVNALSELGAIEEREKEVRVGAIVRQRAAERSAVVARRLPLVMEALPYIGHVQTRNRGTVVGSIVHADPSAELPLVALCLDAIVEIVGPHGNRDATIPDFYQGYLSTDLAADELAVAVRFPAPPAAPGVVRAAAFDEMARHAGDFAIVAAAAQLDVDVAARRIVDARLGLTGVAGVPLRFANAEAALREAAEPQRNFAAVAQAVAGEIDPDSDLHATAEYRRSVARVLVMRVLERAWLRALAGGGGA